MAYNKIDSYWKGNVYRPGKKTWTSGCNAIIQSEGYIKVPYDKRNNTAVRIKCFSGNSLESNTVSYAKINNTSNAYPQPFVRRLAKVLENIIYYAKKDHEAGILDSAHTPVGIWVQKGGGFRYKENEGHHYLGAAVDVYFMNSSGGSILSEYVQKVIVRHRIPCSFAPEGYDYTLHIAPNTKTIYLVGKGKDARVGSLSTLVPDSKVSKEQGLIDLDYIDGELVPKSGSSSLIVSGAASGIKIDWNSEVTPQEASSVYAADKNMLLQLNSYNVEDYVTHDGFTLSFVGISTEKLDEETGRYRDAFEYYLKVTGKANKYDGYILNEMAAQTNQTLQANRPYVFKYSIRPRNWGDGKYKDYLFGQTTSGDLQFLNREGDPYDESSAELGAKNTHIFVDSYRSSPNHCPYTWETREGVTKFYPRTYATDVSQSKKSIRNINPIIGIYIYKRDPLLNKGETPIYIYEPFHPHKENGSVVSYHYGGLCPDVYYTLKLPVTIVNPYIAFRVITPENTGYKNEPYTQYFKDFQLFPANGVATRNETGDIVHEADENNQQIVEHLVQGVYFNNKGFNNKEKFGYVGPLAQYNDNTYIHFARIMSTVDIPFSAYTKHNLKYFYRNNYVSRKDGIGSTEEIQINPQATDEITYIDINADVINNTQIQKNHDIATYNKEEDEFVYYYNPDGTPIEEDIYTYTNGVKDISHDAYLIATTITNAPDHSSEDSIYLQAMSLYRQFTNITAPLPEGHTVEWAAKKLVTMRATLLTIPSGDGKKYNLDDMIITNQDAMATVKDLPEDDALAPGALFYLPKMYAYYKYYPITVQDKEGDWGTGGGWSYAFLGDGYADKRRTLVASKSNRFNLIQELSELFKCWPVFKIGKNPDGSYSKSLWFKEEALRDNFAGFHKGVNVSSLQRSVESKDVVTKMFVEDIDSSFTSNGYVTIRTANYNPWGENYLYNFRYYIEQHLLDQKDEDGNFIIEKECTSLYQVIKVLNDRIVEVNELATSLKPDIEDYKDRIKGLQYYIASANEEIKRLRQNLDTKNQSLTASKEANYREQLNKYIDLRSTYETEQRKLQSKLEGDESTYKSYMMEVNTLQSQKEKRIAEFESKYSDYIKEGVWSDSSYADNDAYYLDAQKVGNTSAVPNASWTIKVIDGECYEELKDFHFKVGDRTFLIDEEFFNKKNTPTGEYKFEVLISGIKQYLDDPTKNEIEVRNYRTSFDDLFQRIAAATQSLSLKEQVYDRGANFTSTGQIVREVIQDTLISNGLTLTSTSDNRVVLDETGLSLQSTVNPMKKLKVTSEGLFLANGSRGDGQTDWKTAISAGGINADIIVTGELDTSKIKIYNGAQTGLEMDKLGFTAYHVGANEPNESDTGSAYGFTRMDQFGIYSVPKGFAGSFEYNGDSTIPWFEGYSREDAISLIEQQCLFSLTDNGFLLNVGTDVSSNWTTYDDYDIVSAGITTYTAYAGTSTTVVTIDIYKLCDPNNHATTYSPSENVLYQDNSGVYGNMFIYTNPPNAVMRDKKRRYLIPYGNYLNYVRLGYTPDQVTDKKELYGLYINQDGKRVVQLQSNGNNIIANWQINDEEFFQEDTTGSYRMGMRAVTKSGEYFLYAGTEGSPEFYVTGDGYLYASNAYIINGMSIGGTTIGDDSISIDYTTIGTKAITVGDIHTNFYTTIASNMTVVGKPLTDNITTTTSRIVIYQNGNPYLSISPSEITIGPTGSSIKVKETLNSLATIFSSPAGSHNYNITNMYVELNNPTTKALIIEANGTTYSVDLN